MNKIKLKLLKLLLPEETLWEMAGNISERFVEKYDDKMETTGEYDDLQEKMFYWIKCGIFN